MSSLIEKQIERLQQKLDKKQIVADRMKGTGRYVFVNKTNVTLGLPKPSMAGKTYIEPNEQFDGDSYFFQVQGVKLVRAIEEPQPAPSPSPTVEQTVPVAPVLLQESENKQEAPKQPKPKKENILGHKKSGEEEGA